MWSDHATYAPEAMHPAIFRAFLLQNRLEPPAPILRQKFEVMTEEDIGGYSLDGAKGRKNARLANGVTGNPLSLVRGIGDS